jgi:hypothetical protein
MAPNADQAFRHKEWEIRTFLWIIDIMTKGI